MPAETQQKLSHVINLFGNNYADTEFIPWNTDSWKNNHEEEITFHSTLEFIGEEPLPLPMLLQARNTCPQWLTVSKTDFNNTQNKEHWSNLDKWTNASHVVKSAMKQDGTN